MNHFSYDCGVRQGETAALPGQDITLSDIRPTKKGRLALFYRWEEEEQFLFSIDEETAALQHVKVGMILSAKQVAQLQQFSDLRRAKDRALQLLSQRDHAACQLYSKLCRSFDEQTAAAAVAQMLRLGLVDDAAFAEKRVQYLAAKGKSRAQIRQDLTAMGIDRQLQQQAMDRMPDDEAETVAHVIKTHYRTKLCAGKRDAVFAALLRRGFSGSAVRRALEQYAQLELPETEYDQD